MLKLVGRCWQIWANLEIFRPRWFVELLLSDQGGRFFELLGTTRKLETRKLETRNIKSEKEKERSKTIYDNQVFMK